MAIHAISTIWQIVRRTIEASIAEGNQVHVSEFGSSFPLFKTKENIADSELHDLVLVTCGLLVRCQLRNHFSYNQLDFPATELLPKVSLGSLRRAEGFPFEAVQRLVVAELNTGLRESKLLAVQRSWIREEADGWWLILPPSQSSLKGTPARLPLNASALRAFKNPVPSITDGRVFRRWDDVRAFKKYWARVCDLAKIQDLHFHDLRHTFTTRLQGLGVDYETRQALLGHSDARHDS
jgi:integrase